MKKTTVVYVFEDPNTAEALRKVLQKIAAEKVFALDIEGKVETTT
ncbi:hypothetical protein [Pseudoflavonifractor sp. 524-17]|nr:hypothetical protein [Pseudoflavonifractor sp. 524-17]